MKHERSGIRRLFRLRSVDRDLDEELESYFEHTVAELIKVGRTRGEAQEEAGRRFGDRTAYRQQLRAIDQDLERRRHWTDRLEAVQQSIVCAARSLARSPGLSVGIILTFALGIGANATMYGIVERLMLRPPPHVVDGDNVRRLYAASYVEPLGRRVAGSTFSYPEFREMQTVRGFSSVAAHAGQDVVVGRGEGAEEALGTWATGNFFELLGVRAWRGRFFTPAEDQVGGARLAVLSYSYWKRKYAGADDAIGQTLDFGTGPYTIVGVAPRGFTGAELTRVDFWIPLHVAAAEVQGTTWADSRGWEWFEMIARLGPGVTPEAAGAEATAVFARAWVESGRSGKDPAMVVASILGARGPLAGSEAVVARLLLAVSLVVLLIACVNVANLMLARTIKQTREIAVRLAIGISRTRLITQILLEGVLLSVIGGAAALAFFKWGGGIVRSVLLPDVAWEESGMTRGVVIMVAVVAVLAGIVAAAVPAFKAARGELSVMLRQASAGGVTRTTARVRTTLALLQTALSVLLLVGAGLFVRSLHRVQDLDLGFDSDGLYAVQPRAVDNAFTGEEQLRVYTAAEERVARISGVAAVGIAESFPFLGRHGRMPRAEGVDSIRRPATGNPLVQQVSPGYFEAMGLVMKRGRRFRDTDSEKAPRVALVNESFARWVWGGQDAIGKCLYIPRDNTRCSEIVGVVEDAVHNRDLSEPMPLQYYVPAAQLQLPEPARLLVVRVPKISTAIERAIAREVVATDSRIRYAHVQSMQATLAPLTRSWALGATMFSVFGVLALVVSALGLYSVLAFDVAQRTRELGVRAALGASRQSLITQVVRRALQVTTVGVLTGICAALLLGRRVQPLLFGVNAHDPLTFAIVAGMLLLVATVAGLFPGWRAARIDPTTALRAN